MTKFEKKIHLICVIWTWSFHFVLFSCQTLRNFEDSGTPPASTFAVPDPNISLAEGSEGAPIEIPLASCLVLNLEKKLESKNCRSIIIEDECPSLAVQSPNYQLAIMNQSCAEILTLKTELVGACVVMNGDEFQCESSQSSYQCAKTLADSKGLYGYFLLNQKCEEPITHTL